MKYFAFLLFLILIQATTVERHPHELNITKKQLMSKVMGGWAGQAIGLVLAETPSPLKDTISQKLQTVAWTKSYPKQPLENSYKIPSDLYLDFTFLSIIEKEGVKAPATSFSSAYTEAGYQLLHANQAARYNILHGIDPPASGHWLNNPHADDADFMMVADFAGLISPGMPRAAAEICEKIGHIMSYGDGYFGGIYIANLYSLAFTGTDIEHMIHEAIKGIPHKSSFYNCISDVVRWHRENPGQWEDTRLALLKKWSDHIHCPGGRYGEAELDAKLQAAYLTLALLYGEGDFTKTFEIISGTGQGLDPSTAGGILGVILGYDNIPDYWIRGVKEIEYVRSGHAKMSLHEAYTISYNNALENIEQNQGRVRQENIIIKLQQPVAVRFERSFQGHTISENRRIESGIITDQFEFEFEGIGFVLRGEITPSNSTSDEIIFAELYLNNKFIEKAALPVNFTTRKCDLFWKFQLPHRAYRARVRILNPSNQYEVRVTNAVVYNVNNN